MIKEKKIFIELPNFLNFSHGTLCIRDLIKSFEGEKIKIIKIKKDITIKKKIKQRFSIADNKSLIINFKKNSKEGDWFLACDTTSSYLLDIARKNNLRIIWWQLAPYNFLGNNQMPRAGEFSLPFSSFTDPNAKNYFYYQAKVDPEWEYALKKMKSRANKKYYKICLYTGKGRLCNLNKKIKNLFPEYNIEIITRLSPKKRSDYFKLLMQSDGLITFDQMTQTNLEATSLGLPVFTPNPLFPYKCLEKFNIKELKLRMSSSPRDFLQKLKSDKNLFYPLEKSYLESFNSITVKSFIEIIKGSKELAPLREKDIKNFKDFTKDLHSKKVIFPFINGGQSPSSILIKRYKSNLINKRNTSFLYFLMSAFDICGYWLFKLKIIRILEVFVIKLIRFSQKMKII